MKLLHILLILFNVRIGAAVICYSCATYNFGHSGFFTDPGAPTSPATISDDCCQNFGNIRTVDCPDMCFSVIITPYAGFWRGCVSRTGTPQLFNGVIAGNCTRQVDFDGNMRRVSQQARDDGRGAMAVCGCNNDNFCNQEQQLTCKLMSGSTTPYVQSTTTPLPVTTPTPATSTLPPVTTTPNTGTSTLASLGTTVTGSTTVNTMSTSSQSTTTTKGAVHASAGIVLSALLFFITVML